MIAKAIRRAKKYRGERFLRHNMACLKRQARRDERHEENLAVRTGREVADTARYRLTERDII